MKKIWREIPKLPLTALLFYLFVLFFWKLGVIPSPAEIVLILESLYLRFGLFGLFVATFLEGVVYLGLYFPGSFIIALAVFLSDGTFASLMAISIVVALTLTLTAFVNYFFGRHISLKHRFEEFDRSKKGLFASMLHPNLLAFYFFNAGIEKRKISKIGWVPVVMIPYGFFLGKLFFGFADFTRQRLESPSFIMGLLLMWLFISFIVEHRNKKMRIMSND